MIKLTEDNIDQAIRDTQIIPIVEGHVYESDADIRGVTSYVWKGMDGELLFDGIVINESTENSLQTTIEDGAIPNLSSNFKPTPDAVVTEAEDIDGNKVYLADKWKLKHISIVDAGRCSPEDGCGIFNYELLLTKKELEGASMPDKDEPKITMCDIAAKIDGLELKLSEQATAYTELEEKYNSLKTADDQMELVLSETKKNLELSAKKEITETREAILKLDKDYPLTDDMSKESMELVLGALRRSSEGFRPRVGADNDPEVEQSAGDIAAEFKQTFMASPKLRR